MKRFAWIAAVTVVAVLAVGVQTSHTQAPAPPPGVPSWAFPTPDANQPPAETGEVRIPDSPKTMTRAQVDDLFNAADWFPVQNTPRPEIVVKGRQPNAMACGVCHLMSGMGHPESADLAGLPVQFIINQMQDFKS